MNMVQILCTHECKWKKIPVETISQIGEQGVREIVGVCEFQYDTLDIL
jgi:hypothetical protein